MILWGLWGAKRDGRRVEGDVEVVFTEMDSQRVLRAAGYKIEGLLAMVRMGNLWVLRKRLVKRFV